jgi:hypothetical protein
MGTIKLALGIDPDLHNTGISFCSPEGVIYAGCVTVPRHLKGEDAITEMARNLAAAFEILTAAPDIVVVEGQQLYTTGPSKHARPQDIVHLANAAGAALGVAYASYPSTVCLLPKPSQWKGNVPKGIKQQRILTAAGVTEVVGDKKKAMPIDIPEWGKGIKRSQWTHVIDAIGCAQWGLTTYHAQRARRLADSAQGD